MHRYTCPTCRVQMSATDEDTLSWGIRTHDCGISPFAGIIRGDDASRLECDVLCWLAGIYGRPFRLHRADGTGAVVT